jgi:phage terminase small subunit
MALTNKQQAFVNAYLETLNAAESARRAGYSEKTARVIGAQNLAKLNIKAEINKRLKERVISAEEVLARLTTHAQADLGAFLTENWQGQITVDLKALKEAGLSHLIKSIANTKFGPKIEFHDPQAALIHLGRYYKLFTDKVQVDDWRMQAIEDIKAGRIEYKALAEAFDNDIATELFRAAGVPVQTE